MTALFWFWLGFAASQFIGLITSTTPGAAIANLEAWLRLFW